MRFLSDEDGQATTEYILMLAIAVAAAIVLLNKFLRPSFAKIENSLRRKIESEIFPSGNALHQLPGGIRNR